MVLRDGERMEKAAGQGPAGKKRPPGGGLEFRDLAPPVRPVKQNRGRKGAHQPGLRTAMTTMTIIRAVGISLIIL